MYSACLFGEHIYIYIYIYSYVRVCVCAFRTAGAGLEQVHVWGGVGGRAYGQ